MLPESSADCFRTAEGNRMKKTVLVLLMLATFGVLIASGIADDGPYHGVTDNVFRPTTVNRTDALEYGLFVNAASFAKGGFEIELPYLESSSFNVASAVKDKAVAQALSNITRFKASSKDLITYILGLVMASGAGYSNIISADAGMGAIIGNWGFALDLKAGIQAMPPIINGKIGPSTSPLGNGYVPMVDLALSAGYGKRVFESDMVNVDIGGAVHFIKKAYLHQITLSVLSEFLDDIHAIDSVKARGGFAVPLDFSITFGLLNDTLKLSAMAGNVNGIYYMWEYNNYKDALLMRDGFDSYIMKSPFQLSFSASYDPGFRFVDPSVYLELTGINGYFTDEVQKRQFNMREVLRFIDAGVGLKVLNAVELRAAYRYGYPEIGASVDVFGNMVELSYGFQEAGAEYGLKPVDHLTVRVRLGYSR